MRVSDTIVLYPNCGVENIDLYMNLNLQNGWFYCRIFLHFGFLL